MLVVLEVRSQVAMVLDRQDVDRIPAVYSAADPGAAATAGGASAAVAR